MLKTLGLRHLALRVRDIQRSKAFYTETMGMRVVWEPDARNSYLTSGTDNLALHELDPNEQILGTQSLDHLGFIVGSPDEVRLWADHLEARGANIIAPPRAHRDGSFSLYLTDPDQNLIQILYLPDTLIS